LGFDRAVDPQFIHRLGLYTQQFSLFTGKLRPQTIFLVSCGTYCFFCVFVCELQDFCCIFPVFLHRGRYHSCRSIAFWAADCRNQKLDNFAVFSSSTLGDLENSGDIGSSSHIFQLQAKLPLVRSRLPEYSNRWHSCIIGRTATGFGYSSYIYSDSAGRFFSSEIEKKNSDYPAYFSSPIGNCRVECYPKKDTKRKGLQRFFLRIRIRWERATT